MPAADGHWATTSHREGAAGRPVSQETSRRPESRQPSWKGVATLKFVRRLAPVGAILTLACAPAALAATGPSVTVRVEGKTKTLLAPKVVHTHSGWITRFGEKTGSCPADSDLGALDQATHHSWKGKVFSSTSGLFVNSI